MKLFVIAVVLIGLGIVAATIIVGQQYFEGVVVENPYDQGLLWDKVQKERIASGWAVAVKNEDSLRPGDTEAVIEVKDGQGRPLGNASVSVRLSRPSTTEYDRRYETLRLADGLYSARVTIPLYGYWDFEVTVRQGERSVPFLQRVYVKKSEERR